MNDPQSNTIGQRNSNVGGSDDALNPIPGTLGPVESSEIKCEFCAQNAIDKCAGCQKQFCTYHFGSAEAGARVHGVDGS